MARARCQLYAGGESLNPSRFQARSQAVLTNPGADAHMRAFGGRCPKPDCAMPELPTI